MALQVLALLSLGAMVGVVNAALNGTVPNCSPISGPASPPASPPANAPCGSISGTVTDTAAHPLGGICVSSQEISTGRFGNDRTDAAGNYLMTNLIAGSYRVQFYDCTGGTHLTQWYNNEPDFGSANLVTVAVGADTPNINAALVSGGTISGTVTDTAGHALAGVCINAQDPTTFAFGFATTNASGRYSTGAMTPGSYKVQFSDCFAGNHLTQWYNNQPDFGSANPVTVSAGVNTPNVNAVLAAAGSISGTVTDTSGLPLANVCVNVQDATTAAFVGFASTNAAGSYAVPRLAGGSYKVQFADCFGGTSGATHLGQWYNNQPNFGAADPVVVTTGANTANINAVMVTGGSLSGTVTEATSGVALGGICVTVQDASGSFIGFTSTNSTGGYALGGLATGSYKVQFADCNTGAHALQWFQNKTSFATATPVSVTVGVNTANINAVLVVGGKISGTVTDQSGQGVGAICVIAQDPNTGFTVSSTTTKAGGAYVIGGLGTGSYKVQFNDCGAGVYATQWFQNKTNFGAAKLVAVKVGRTTVNINAVLT